MKRFNNVKNKFSDVRKIKVIGDIIKENNTILMPNTLELASNNSNTNIYPTQFFLDKTDLAMDLPTNNKQIIKTNKTTSQFMEIPDLSLPLTDILNIYNIDTYEELIGQIKKLIFEEKSKFTIYRLVNTYVRIFFDDLNKTSNSLVKILKIIFDNYKISDEKLMVFLKKWFEKNDKNNFNMNICEDVKYFLSNKYESN